MKHIKGFNVVPYKDVVIGRLYQTNIFILNYADNTLTLNSGGWRTRHTLKCLNAGLEKFNVHVYQKKHDWYVDLDGRVLDFKDGMILTEIVPAIDGVLT